LTASTISWLAIPPVLTTHHAARTLDLRDYAFAVTAMSKPTFAFSQPELAVGGCWRFLAVMFSATSEGDRYRAKEGI
jgi:hypothetical protein